MYFPIHIDQNQPINVTLTGKLPCTVCSRDAIMAEEKYGVMVLNGNHGKGRRHGRRTLHLSAHVQK